MRIGINSQLPSILAFSTDMIEFELHTDYSGIEEQIKPLQELCHRWSGGRVQVRIQVQAGLQYSYIGLILTGC